MTKCVICYNQYGEWRAHCPTCGTFRIGEKNFSLAHHEIVFPIVAARNAERQRPTYQSMKQYRMCDGV